MEIGLNCHSAAKSRNYKFSIMPIGHDLTILPILDYFSHVITFTRNYHCLHYILPSSNSDSYKSNFFPSIIQTWNNLPISIIESDSPGADPGFLKGGSESGVDIEGGANHSIVSLKQGVWGAQVFSTKIPKNARL